MAMRGSALAIAALLALTLATALVRGAGRAPDAGRETTYWLAVESLAVDGDLRLEEGDRARFATRFGARPEAAQVAIEAGEKRLDAPWLWTRLAAAARATLGGAGAPIVQAALFAWTALVATATLTPRLGGGSAALLVAVSLLASAAFALPFRLEPRALELAAMTTAAAAIWYRRLGPARAPEDVYRGGLDVRPSLLRWLVAGACGAVVVAASIAYLPLLAPLVAAAPAERRGRAAALLLAGFTAVTGALVLIAGPLWDPIAVAPSFALYGWSALGLLVGRGVGLLPYFLPALLLVTLGGRGEGRGWVLPALAAAVALQVALAPFDWVEGALTTGNAWFLPPLALLLCAAESTESPRATLALAVVSLPLLVVPWLDAVGARRAADFVAGRVAPFERLLPAASTLRLQPGTFDVAPGGLVARGFVPGFAGGHDGRLRLVGARADLLVSSDKPLSSLRLELGANAPVALDVRGGKLGNTTLRPSGEVAIDVALDPRQARRHPVWWSPDGAWIYPLELRLEGAPREPVALAVPFGRLVVPQDGAP